MFDIANSERYSVYNDKIRKLVLTFGAHMQRCLLLAAFLTWISGLSFAQEPRLTPLPHPSLGPDSWVLIEIWPEVMDITLSAYFLDNTSAKNQRLCEATKLSLDRDATTLGKEQGQKFTSYRKCLTVRDAIKIGYVDWK